ncbi:Lactation elevated protein 1 [Cichlidogyrus casuarinus]|uniref:Lactation elevated protein 1 n=1 Tax=Cichlidogyrus casuarinus TaxID=1844966 RepID=A0ABD2QGZ1_9PLAT
MIANQGFHDDVEQRATLDYLQALSKELASSPLVPRNLQGMYIYGSVGCGKTMLMDLFFSNVNVSKKWRTHFHPFMKHVHSRLHIARSQAPKRHLGRFTADSLYDPIKLVATELANQYNLLCFDEFQVTDIADAMILKRFFEVLFENKVIVVATSNRPPEDLYKNGLQRVNFLPFIDILKSNCKTVHLNSKSDYRTIHEGHDFSSNDRYCTDMMAFEKALRTLTNGQTLTEEVLNVSGRKLRVKALGDIALCNFSDLCEKVIFIIIIIVNNNFKPLGASDYMALSKRFKVVFLSDVPVMGYDNMSYLRRFITLIDVLYDNRVRLVIQASTNPRKLFNFYKPSETGPDFHSRQLLDDFQMDSTSAPSLLTNEEEIFAVDRTISRLIEMKSDKYWLTSGNGDYYQN